MQNKMNGIIGSAAAAAALGIAAYVAAGCLRKDKKLAMKKQMRCKLGELQRMVDTADRFVRSL